MYMNKTNQEKILQAFIALLKEKPLNKITASEIAKKAKMSRMTFYNSFANIHGIFSYIVFEKLIKHSLDPFPNIVAAMTATCKLARDLDLVFKGLLKSEQRHTFKDFCLLQGYKFHERWILKYDQQRVIPEQARKNMAKFYVAGFVDLLFAWIDNDFQDDEHLIIQDVYLFFHGSIERAIENFSTKEPLKKLGLLKS